MQKIKLLSLFSGIGAFEKALFNLGIPFEVVGFSEIDKQVARAYSLLHHVPLELNLGDISKKILKSYLRRIWSLMVSLAKIYPSLEIKKVLSMTGL